MHIVIIEDHKLVCDMLALACRTIVPAAEITVADTSRGGLAACSRARPDLIFLDLVLPDGDGLDLVPDIRAHTPSVRIIALSSFADEYTVYRVERAAVDGFVDKNEQPIDVLKEAVETVLAGKRYLSPVARRLHAALRADPAAFDKVLSDQEQRLLVLLGEGLTNAEVAKQLGMTENTIKVHRRNIHQKLGIHSAPELMRYAVRKGFTRLRGRN